MVKIILPLQDDGDIFYEDIKTLRTNIMFCGEDKQVILLASCMSGEGKSTVAQELARAFAKMKKKTLLIDADLRKGGAGKEYNIDNVSTGLAHYLVGQCKMDDIICETNIQDLYFIPDGATPPNATELLSSAHMKELIENARKAFDYIIVDCAPLGAVIDGAVVATYCDGAIMLMEANRVPRRLGENVKEQLTKSGCPILGAVLNKVEPKSSYYYHYDTPYGIRKKYGAATEKHMETK